MTRELSNLPRRQGSTLGENCRLYNGARTICEIFKQGAIMSGDVSVDIGSALGYIEDRVRVFFGKDPETLEWNHRLKERLRYAVEQARWVQCIGMSEPIPIAAIYQPLLLDSRTTGTSLLSQWFVN